MTNVTSDALGATSGVGNGGGNGAGNGKEAEAEQDRHARGRRLEIWKPPTDGIGGYMWLEIVDPYGIPPANIIKYPHDWIVRCHVWLEGDIWKCVCGEICTEVCFNPCHPEPGEPPVYKLEDLAGEPLCLDFKGCDHYFPGDPEGHVHASFEVRVPAGALPSGPDGKPKTYEWTATLSFKNPCDEYEPIAGFDHGMLAVHQD